MEQTRFKFVGASMVALMTLGVMSQPVAIFQEDLPVFAEEATETTVAEETAAEETAAEEAASEDTSGEESSEVPAASEDFFEFVNKEYLDSFEMASDEVAVGVNDELDARVEEALKKYLGDLDSEATKPATNEEQQMLNYYRLANDFDKREEDGAKPVEAYLNEIKGLTSMEDFTGKLSTFVEKNYILPFQVYSTPGLDDPNMNQMMIGSGRLILPDTSYYEEGNEDGASLMEAYQTSSEKIMEAVGFTPEEAKTHVQNAIAFDAIMASYRTPSEERMNTSDNIFPTERKDAEKLTEVIGLMPVLDELVGTSIEMINVDDQKFSGGLNDMFKEENFEQLQSWMLVRTAEDAAPYMTEELRLLSEEYSMAKSGAEEAPAQDKAAYEDTIYRFGDVVGNAYGETEFGPEARKDVEELTYDIIDMYKVRLKEEHDWLSPETVEKAIEKLDKMGVMVGYADEYNKNTKDYVVDPEKTLYENVHGINEVDHMNSLKDYGKEVAEGQWGMAPFEVNAYYNPYENLICLPAGILQDPFYSTEQTDSENYGGVGNVVGHELSHAFDTSGAEFDAEGVFTNWWTEEDYAAFEERTKPMVTQYDGYEIHGGTVDGEQTLNENIADNGGVAVALEALKRKGDANFAEYFETYAKTWAIRLRPEFTKMRLTTDEHGPAEARVNFPVANFDEFYETYDVKEGDKMYIAPEDRMIFW